MRSFVRVAIGLAAFGILALVLSLAWVLLITVIGWATDSGAIGPDGPYGPLAGILMIALIAGVVGAVVAAFFLARRVLRNTPAFRVFTSSRRRPESS